MGGVGDEMRVLESREWYIASYAPQGVSNSDHLKIRTAKLSLALETLFLSVDPSLRSRMTGREDGLCFPQFNLNEVIVAFGVGRVMKSNDTNYSEGDIVISVKISKVLVLPHVKRLKNQVVKMLLVLLDS